MERIRLRFKSMLLLFGLVIAMGCGIPSICMTEKEVMAEEVTPAVGDEFTSEGITYRITSLPGTYAGKLSVTDGKAAEGNVVLKDGMEYAGGAYDVVELAASAFGRYCN
ncbi:MAG: hypothetical protein MR380_07675 [Lachnospiraceae bacterium]|nr:hypothetical protein [Lachnospiraceae bacterium]